MKQRRLNALIFLLFLLYTLYGCAFNEREVDLRQYVSSSLNYEELVQYYAELQGVSEEESINELYQANVRENISENNNEQVYRILCTPIRDKEQIYEAVFLVETKEENTAWEIVDVRCAWIKDLEDSKLLFSGTIALWVREEKAIEYSINGDFCKVSDVALEINKDKKNTGMTIHFSPETEAKSSRHIYVHNTSYFE